MKNNSQKSRNYLHASARFSRLGVGSRGEETIDGSDRHVGKRLNTQIFRDLKEKRSAAVKKYQLKGLDTGKQTKTSSICCKRD